MLLTAGLERLERRIVFEDFLLVPALGSDTYRVDEPCIGRVFERVRDRLSQYDSQLVDLLSPRTSDIGRFDYVIECQEPLFGEGFSGVDLDDKLLDALFQPEYVWALYLVDLW